MRRPSIEFSRMLTRAALASCLICAAPVVLGSGAGYFVSAPVVDVVPIYQVREINEPETVCRDVRRPVHRYRDDYPRRADPVRTLIGGVIGGVIGNQFGGGNGKRVLTAVGALTGAAIASASNDRREYRHYDRVQSCHVVDRYTTVREIDGYDVTYAYQGREFTQRMDEHPGEVVRLHVRVTPETYAAY